MVVVTVFFSTKRSHMQGIEPMGVVGPTQGTMQRKTGNAGNTRNLGTWDWWGPIWENAGNVCTWWWGLCPKCKKVTHAGNVVTWEWWGPTQETMHGNIGNTGNTGKCRECRYMGVVGTHTGNHAWKHREHREQREMQVM